MLEVRCSTFRFSVTLPQSSAKISYRMRSPAINPAPLLKVKNLSRDFGGLRAVTSISFEVLPGEIVGLIGPNGAGKTTLLRAITGLLPLKAGRIRFLGQEIQG